MGDNERIYKYIDLAADRAAVAAVEHHDETHKYEARLQSVEKESGKHHTHIAWIRRSIYALFATLSTMAWMHFK